MKKLFFFSVFLITMNGITAQVCLVKGEKVEIRDYSGRYISSRYFSGVRDADASDEMVVIWYSNDKVETRNPTLEYLASGYFSGISKVRSSGNHVVLYYISGKVEVRDADLRYISSFYW